ncbi:MAG: outer membrane lipoprotein carrier protein LolA [Treponema sp.]|nr:outer membrane lipoprotein carrier protein LolA [Treponema sp.]
MDSRLSKDRMLFVKYLPLVVFLALAPLSVFCQDITTADQYFSQVADRYAQINDYEGRITITAGKSVMTGNIAFKAPSLLRIDFIQPPDQVINFDGQTLQVYLPAYHAILSQQVSDKAPSGIGGAALASREGLRLMSRAYGMAFESSPAPVPLENGGGEQVVRLVLNRRSVAEGFRTIILSIDPNTKLIRRIEGWTIAGDKIVFDFTGIKLNQGIPAAHFIYDSPASANVYNNFLFGSAAQ